MMTEPGPATSQDSSNERNDHETLREIFKDASATTDMDPNVWIPQLKDKIITMLKSPLKQEFNNEVYNCIFQLCMFKKRFTWLCSNETKGWTKEEAKHFSFITRLSLNELHILLPRLKQHLMGGDQAELEDGKVMSRPANLEEYHQFDVHLMILEDTIQSLVHDQDDDDDDDDILNRKSRATKLTDSMEANELKSLLERMKEVLVEMFDYLELVHKHWAQLVDQPTGVQFCASQGALRIGLVWVSEDVGSFQPQCKSFFIDLIIKYLLVRHLLPDSMPDLLVMALQAICLVGNDGNELNEMKQKFREISSHRAALQGYLDFVQDKQRRIDEKETSGESRESKRRLKEFKFRCALIRDLLREDS